MDKDKPKDVIVAVLIIIPRQKPENMVFYDNKQLNRLVGQKIKFFLLT